MRERELSVREREQALKDRKFAPHDQEEHYSANKVGLIHILLR